MGTLETHQSGLAAEMLASVWLMLHGWQVMNRRFKTPVGEVDIIAKRGRVIAFIEVKRRANLGDGLAAVQPQTVARVRRAAEWWLKSRPALADKCDIRFDAIAVAPYCRIRHVPNAF